VWAFRHWDRRWLEDARSKGRLLLRAADYYKRVEQPMIQDDMELEVRGTTGTITFPNHEPSIVRERLANLGIRIDKSGVAKDLKFIRHTKPCYLFCMSRDGAPGKFDAAGDNKNAVTKVGNVGKLAVTIVDAMRGELATAEWAPVRYERRVFSAGLEEALVPEAFVKPVKFAPDKEIRIALFPKGEMEPQIIVQDASIARLFTGYESI
jgi:hypothetical protein